MRAAALGVALGFVAALAAEGRARACSPPAPGIRTRTIVPPDGATGVPTNAEIRVSYDARIELHDAQVRVRAPGELAVEAEVELIPRAYGTTIVVRPAEPLAPNTTYEIFDRLEVPCDGWDDCDAGSFGVIATFETGDGPDDEPPQFAGLESLDSRYEVFDDSCGSYTTVLFTLSWSPATDDGPQAWLRYNVYGDGGREVAARVGGETIRGQALCSGSPLLWPLEAEFSGPTGPYVVRAVDLAGNEDANERRLETIACDDGSDAGPGGEPAPGDAGPPDAGTGGAGGSDSGGASAGGCALSPTCPAPGTGWLALIAVGALATWRAGARRRRS